MVGARTFRIRDVYNTAKLARAAKIFSVQSANVHSLNPTVGLDGMPDTAFLRQDLRTGIPPFNSPSIVGELQHQ